MTARASAKAHHGSVDFLVIGAQKAGTTTLFEYLRRHPEIELPPDKEAPFFSHDPTWKLGWEAYLMRTFGRIETVKKRGTVTPQYMAGSVFSPIPNASAAHYDETTVPLRIRECAPEVCLIALLRDPVSRALSHHTMCVMKGEEHRSFDRAVDELLDPSVLRHARDHPSETTGYVVWGEYGRILRGYINVFGRDRLLVIFANDLDHHPEAVLQSIHRFLGIRIDLTPDNLGVRYREASAERRLVWLRPYAVQDWVARSRAAATISHLLPASLRLGANRRFARMAYRLTLWNRRPLRSPPAPLSETLERLRCHYKTDTAELIDLIGVAPPWVTLERSV